MSIPFYSPAEDKVVHYTSVDFAARYINAPVHLVQYDNGLPIIAVSLYLNGVPYEIPDTIDTANVRVAKTDNKYVYNPVLGTNSERNVLYVEVTRQMVAAYGDEHPILELVKYATEIDQIVASGSFHVIVDPNPVRDTNIESSSEYKAAKEFAVKSQSYAVGGTGTREGEDTNNAEYFYKYSKIYMEDASSSANESATKASESRFSAERALSSETNARRSETNAATSASNASISESNAASAAYNAGVLETRARESANTATANANTSTNMANMSKSYAVGGTGTRSGENTDNSKWYAEQARNSENTVIEAKNKAVEYGDLAKSYAVGETGTRSGENTDNAKYYSDSARSSETNAALSASFASDSAEIAKAGADAVTEALTPGSKLPRFVINLETGNLEYEGSSFVFIVNDVTGELEYELAI